MKNKLENFLFHGNVREPIPIVVLVLLVGVIFLAFAIWASVESLSPFLYKPVTKETQFVGYEQDGPIYSLLSLDGQSYDLPVASIADNSLLDSLINDEISVLIEIDSPDNEEGHSLDILSVSLLDGTSIISSDNIHAARVSATQRSAVIMWAASLAYWTFAATSYYFISNATRYPKIAALLVRESFRNF